MATHQAFHLKIDGMERKLCLMHPRQFYLSSVNLNCRPGMCIQNEISPSSLQITVPRNTVISVSEPAPADQGQPGQRPQPSIRFCPVHISSGARDTKLLAATRAVETLMTKAANMFHLGVSFVMLNKWGKN